MLEPPISVKMEEIDKNNSTEGTAKRRGRKRKSEIIEVEVNSIDSTSRKGRPRKQINYFELANPERLDDYSETDSYSSPSSKRVKSEISPKSEKSGAVAIEPEESGLMLDDKNGVVDQISKNVDASVSSAETTLNNSCNNSDKKYTFTGNTVQMLNTLFTMYSNKVTDNGSHSMNVENITNNNANQEGKSYQNRGSKKKFNKSINSETKAEKEDESVITCAVCQAVLEKSLWAHHKQRYHNNLAWRIGDPPLDLSDQSFVMYTLNTLYKKKKPLYCQCGEVKKSVVGFLSHQATCQKSEEQLEAVKVACEICQKKVLPVSMTTHMKFVHGDKKKQSSKEKVEVKSTVLGRKRGAAKKALKFLQNISKDEPTEETNFTSNLDFDKDYIRQILKEKIESGETVCCKYDCEFSSNNLEEIISHHNECNKKLQSGYMCKLCLQIHEKLEEIIFHIDSSHDVTVKIEGDEEKELEDSFSYNQKTSNTVPCFLQCSLGRTAKALYEHAFNWTYDFHKNNDSNYLFPDLSFNESNWLLIPASLIEDYLPKMGHSCDVAMTNVRTLTDPVLKSEYTLKKYELFESELHEDNKITIFCGGPVAALAWLPTPLDECQANQILAVSILDSPDDKYLVGENFSLAGSIQFWNFGAISNKENPKTKPELVFNLAHNHGPVWHMEWCPSGCFNFNKNQRGRMGLLAVTGSDSIVYIYAIPFFKQDDMGLFYKSKAVMKLVLQRPNSSLLGGSKYYPSKMSWSQAKGHDSIVVGYTNGFVAVFDLNTKRDILKYTDSENVTCLLPQKLFQAHSHAITACQLYKMQGGPRWLMTASIDRSLSAWDLNNFSYPLYTMKSNLITDGLWFSNWLAHIISADEGSSSSNIATSLKHAADYASDLNREHTLSLSVSNSTIKSVASSDWLNGFMQGSMMGEITALFPHQLLGLSDLPKIIRKKRMLFGFATLIDKNKSPEERYNEDKRKKAVLKKLQNKKHQGGVSFSNITKDNNSSYLLCDEPFIYADAEQRYGVLFCDNKMESYDDFPVSVALTQLASSANSLSIAQPNQFPMTAINKVVFNPNRQASLYFATGYQIGFVRLSCMNFLKDDPQIQ